MNKKWWMAGGAFCAGAAMLLASGISAMASTSGYDAYDAAMKRTAEAASLTASVNLTVSDNGHSLLAAGSDIRWDQSAHAGSMAAKADLGGAGSHAANVYFQDGKLIVKTADSDVYRVKEVDGKTDRSKDKNPHAPPKAALQLFDALTGHMKELVTAETSADGSRHAALHLAGGRIPAAVNALGALAVTGLAGDGKAGRDLPKLTDAVKVERIDLGADIAPDGALDEQTAYVVVTGKDAAGAKHELDFRLRVDFTGYNATSPERVDLAGQKVEPFDDGHAGHGPWHR